MRVRSPVGHFPLRFKGIDLDKERVSFRISMGSWPAEVSLDRFDLPLLLGAIGLLFAVFKLGRMSENRRPLGLGSKVTLFGNGG